MTTGRATPQLDQILATRDRRVTVVYLGALIAALAFVMAKSVIVGVYLGQDLAAFDNDSVMRLVSVRNWLGGQPWFDTVEYRLLPPEGTLMHWSRYIDAVIGGLILLLSNFMPKPQAELWAVTIWPVALSLLLVILLAEGTRRLFGPVAASFAALTVSIWPVSQQFYFLPGKIDHHNVQIVLITVITLLALSRRNHLRAGILAGLAAALGLAIGLETLLYILCLGAVLFVRANLQIGRGSDALLAGFSVALPVGAVVLWLGQTPAARLGVPVCDQLGLPVLTLAVIAALASILPMVLLRGRPVARLLAGVGIVALGCLLAWPLLGPCLEGPYGSLPPDVQEIIRTRISEARPALIFAQRDWAYYMQLALPVAGGLAFGTYLWSQLPRDTEEQIVRRDTFGVVLILCCVGFVASFAQIRLLLMSVPTAPIVVGVVMASFVGRYLRSRSINDAVIMFAIFVALVAPLLIRDQVRRVVPVADEIAHGAIDEDCRIAENLAALNALPPAVFLTPINLGAPLLVATHHATLSAPYHRRPEPFSYGIQTFRLPETEMREMVRDSGADYIILCQTSSAADSYAAQIVAGAEPDWLRRVDIDAGNLLVFEIIPAS